MTVKRVQVFWLLTVVAAAPAAAVSFTSGPAPVALIELYTSEGCSSCPPAEHWLGNLRDDPRLWREFVPVAFHVHYWDYIGWKDRFASPAFTDRQRAIARSWRSGRVYTPCFVRNGREWRTRDLAGPEARGVGVLTVNTTDNGRVRAHFQPAAVDGTYDVFVAVLGGGIISPVRAGENAGRKLAHEFVALALRVGKLKPESTAGDVLIAEFDLELRSLPETPRRALAAWVALRGELAPVQAAGGWLPGKE